LNGSRQRIKDLPLYQRPREKAIRYGINALTNVELLAILINSGTRGESALVIAENLLIKYQGLTKLANLTEISEFGLKGIKSIKAVTLLAAFKLSERIQKENYSTLEYLQNSSELANKYLHDFSAAKNEMFLVVSLNKHLKIIREQVLYVGTKHGFNLDVKEIVSVLEKQAAKYYVMVHNHPSGTAYPSHEDLVATRKIRDLTSIRGIFLYDHLIIANYSYFSMKDNELI